MRPPRALTRRTLLGAAGAAGAVALAGCGEEPPATETADADPPGGGAERVRYGEDESQFADLRRPSGTPLATVALFHGGYWLPQYGLDQLDPMAEELTRLGYATWNIEYRRTGDGGEWPHTLEDAAAAMDALADQDGLGEKVVTLGHSAGGHLAVWVASRSESTPGGAPSVPVRSAVSLAGVLDLTRAADVPGSAERVRAFVGGSPVEVPDRYALADPALLVPASFPVRVVQAEDDQVVPPEQGERYVAAARKAGGVVSSESVPGDHFTIIEPTAESFATIQRLLEQATRD